MTVESPTYCSPVWVISCVWSIKLEPAAKSFTICNIFWNNPISLSEFGVPHLFDIQLYNMLHLPPPSPFQVLVLGYFWGGDICRVNAVCEEHSHAEPPLSCCCCTRNPAGRHSGHPQAVPSTAALPQPRTLFTTYWHNTVSPAARPLSVTHTSIHYSIVLTYKVLFLSLFFPFLWGHLEWMIMSC